MDRLWGMQVAVTIADEGSLTAAARRLGKSLPTIVRTLAALEQHLETRLFNRTTRRVALTEEGRTYVERSRGILADVEATELELLDRTPDPGGRLVVTAPVLFGQARLGPAVTSFLQEYPRVRVELLLLDRVVDLLDEGVDVALRIAPLSDSSMIARSLGKLRTVVCASPELLGRCGEPDYPGQLVDLPAVLPSGLSDGGSWTFVDSGRALKVAPDPRVVCNQASYCVAACEAGLGFGRFLAYQVADAVQSGRLRIVLSDFEPAPTPVSLVYPHSRLLSRRVRAFVDGVAARMRPGLAHAGLHPTARDDQPASSSLEL